MVAKFLPHIQLYYSRRRTGAQGCKRGPAQIQKALDLVELNPRPCTADKSQRLNVVLAILQEAAVRPSGSAAARRCVHSNRSTVDAEADPLCAGAQLHKACNY